MARRCDGHSDSDTFSVTAAGVHVDRALADSVDRPPLCHRVPHGGLIHVQSELWRTIPIIYDGNHHLEVAEGFLHHLFRWALRSLHRHVMRKVVSHHKPRESVP